MMLRRTILFTMILCAAASSYGQKRKAAPPAQPDDNLVRVLRTPNKAQVNRYVCEALTFKNINPFNVINFFWAVTSREEGGIYSFSAPEGKSGYVVVICPEYQLPTLRKLAQDLDRPQLNSAPGSAYIYYRMVHRNVADPGFRAALAYYAGSSGLLVPDVETNSLLIYDAPEGAKSTENTLREALDAPLGQTEIGVNVYEISINNDATLGLDFEAWKNGPGKLLGQYDAKGAYLNTSGVGHTHFTSSSNGVFLDYPSSFFDFLVEKGQAKLLINTKISATNHIPAVLSTASRLPIMR